MEEDVHAGRVRAGEVTHLLPSESQSGWEGRTDVMRELLWPREVKLFAFPIIPDPGHPSGMPQALGSLLADIADFEI